MGYYDDTIAKGFDQQPTDPFNPPRPKEQPWFDLEDILLAAPRGVVGAAKGAYSLVDTLTADVLPDWNENPLGESKSIIGGWVEGAAHFTAGFVPFGGFTGGAGLVAKLITGGSKLAKVGRVATASGLAGFTVFEGHEARLSDLVERNPGLQNPITEFLASDEDDPELLGRLKNAIEQAGMGAATEGLVLGIKSIAAGRRAKSAVLERGGTPEAAAEAAELAAAEVAPPDQMIALMRDANGLNEADALSVTGVHERIPSATERTDVRLETDLLAEPTAAELASPDLQNLTLEFRRDAMVKYPDLPESEAVLKHFESEVDEIGRIATAGDEIARKGAKAAQAATPEPAAAPAPAAEPVALVNDTPARAKRVPMLRRLGLDDAKIAKFTEAFERKAQAIDEVTGEKIPQRNPREMSAADRLRIGLKEADLPMQNFRSPESAYALSRTIEDFFRVEMEADFKMLAPKTLEEIVEEGAARTAEMLGFKDAAAYIAATQVRGGRTVQSLADAIPMVQSDRTILEIANRKLANAFDLRAKIRAGEAAGSEEEVMVEFVEALQHAAGMDAIVKGEARQAGRLLRSLSTTVGGVEIPPELLKLGRDPARLRQMLAEGGGPEAIGKVMDKYAAAWKLAGEEGGDAALAKLRRATLGRKFLDMTTEFFMGSVLSSPQTWVVNAASNTISQLYLPLERALGSSMVRLSGGRLAPATELALQQPIVRESLAQLTSTKRSLVDAVRMFADSGWNPESAISGAGIADKGTRAAAITAANLGLKPESLQARMVNWLGEATRTPMKILGGTDVVAKNTYYRAAGFARLQTEAIEAGIKDPVAIAKHADARLNQLVLDGQAYTQKAIVDRGISAAKAGGLTDPAEIQKYVVDYYGRNFDPKLAAISEQLVAEAEVATFTNRALPGTVTANIQNFLNQHPALKLVAPFVNTPMNLIKGAGQRADAIGVARYIAGRVWPRTMPELEATSNRFLRDMLSGDPRKAADAVGRISVGVGAATFFTSEALAGNITGRGPVDPQQRQALIDTGWQPYSFKVGDSYISYARLDPFATFIGTAADMAEYMNHAQDVDDEDHATAITGLAIGMANNFTNKSYLTGFANMVGAMQAPEKKLPVFFRRQAAAFIPNVLGTAGYGFGQDPNLREVQSFTDALMDKIPYFSKKLPPRRNILGEPLESPMAAEGKGALLHTAVNLWDPIKYSRVKDDVVRNELAALGHAWEPPKRRTNGVDLMEVPSGKTTAYDRWQELQGSLSIGGLRLKDALRKEIMSPGYRKLTPEATDGLESPRVGRLSRIISTYRARAWKQMLNETPALRQHDLASTANKHRLRAGLPAAIIPGL